MEFSEEKPIWRQIYDLVCTRILSGEWEENSRIVSVRELAADVGVNPNTVMRSYEKLELDKIIYNRRGIGFFVADGAKDHILEIERNEFLSREMPVLLERMRLLGITLEEFSAIFREKAQESELNE